jgi:hypothetical protein
MDRSNSGVVPVWKGEISVYIMHTFECKHSWYKYEPEGRGSIHGNATVIDFQAPNSYGAVFPLFTLPFFAPSRHLGCSTLRVFLPECCIMKSDWKMRSVVDGYSISKRPHNGEALTRYQQDRAAGLVKLTTRLHYIPMSRMEEMVHSFFSVFVRHTFYLLNIL